MFDPNLDLTQGWRGVPGWFSGAEGEALQQCVKLIPPGQAYVELGSWCGRSFVAALEATGPGVIHFSYDPFPPKSQAVTEAGRSADWARGVFRAVLRDNERLKKDVRRSSMGSAEAGEKYDGPPVCVLLVDDHHSGPQVAADIVAWRPHLAEHCAILFHDYASAPFGLAEPISQLLSSPPWALHGIVDSMAVFAR